MVADVDGDLVFFWIVDDVHFNFVAEFIRELSYFPGVIVDRFHIVTYSSTYLVKKA
ncbi:hypothetical protein V7654_18880 [Bacillus sp. JJ1609]|uniref:hypothetical protein n=1 Tax=Bacillus sp. JJ1609 TaxID=3122977 RepID=UPI002FFE514E